MQPIWEGLAARRWTVEQLQQLQRALHQDDHLENVVQALNGERVFFCATLDSIHRSSECGEAFFSGGGGKPVSDRATVLARLTVLSPQGWIDQNKAASCRLCQWYIDTVDLQQGRISLRKLTAASAAVQAMEGKPVSFAYPSRATEIGTVRCPVDEGCTGADDV